MKHYPHDPDADLDYGWDWTPWLAAGETIDTATVTVTEGTATVHDQDDDGTAVTAWISDAASGRVVVTCHIVTTADRKDDRSIILDVRQR